MNTKEYFDNATSLIQSSFVIPVQPVNPARYNCISCGENTPYKKGSKVFDSVTKRMQFFCFDCLNTSNAVQRRERIY